ncbi:hypothetical protein WEI85_39915 [Actinomycetes bacterium KLBMP 9797]
MTTTPPAPDLPRREVIGAWLLLLGFAALWLGVAWDGQWHIDVGPDTFFTAPHLMFYFGTSLIGLTALVVVLATTREVRRAREIRRGGARAGVRVLGRFSAPVPFLVAGLGAAGHLVYGAADLWWHTVYGFDILEETPAHLSLSLAMQVEVVAVVLAFAAPRAAARGHRSWRWGLVAAGALSVAAATLMLDGAVLGVDMSMLVVGAGCAWALSLVAGVTRDPRWVLATGLLFAAVQAATLAFPPFVTEAYADALGLPFRDDSIRLSVVGIALPMVVPVVAALAAGVVWLARRRAARPRTAMLVLGALAAPLTALYVVVTDDALRYPLPNLVLVGAVGAAVAWFGWQFAFLATRKPKAST